MFAGLIFSSVDVAEESRFGSESNCGRSQTWLGGILWNSVTCKQSGIRFIEGPSTDRGDPDWQSLPADGEVPGYLAERLFAVD